LNVHLNRQRLSIRAEFPHFKLLEVLFGPTLSRCKITA
jgi:hypothetical protein